MVTGRSSTAARSAARSMIFRPRTDELAPRAGVCTRVYMYPVAESGPTWRDKRARKKEREMARVRGEKEREREREREKEREEARSLPR